MSNIELNNVNKVYNIGEGIEVNAANNVNFSIEKGEFVVILGPSGAGKTTVLNLLGGMDDCTSGSIVIDNQDISDFSKRELTEYRRTQVGFVFQFYNLVGNLTAKENVELATQDCKNSISSDEVLEQVGLKDRMHNFPSQLSGGEQQRVAIARALGKKPKILLCDEPTGALDSNTGKSIMNVLKSVARDLKHTLIIVTHNSELGKAADKVIRMKNGAVEEVVIQNNPLNLEELQW